MRSFLKNRSGQTLVEAMVALGILTIGLLGIIGMLARSFFLNRVAADNAKGTYLAAEGIEIMKNLIDHDVYLSLAGLGGGWGTTCFGVINPNGYEVDYTTGENIATPCPTIYSGRKLLLNPATHMYNYAGGAATSFVRKIVVSRPTGSEIKIQSIVTWTSGPLNQQSITLEDHFYDWRL